MPAKNKYQHIIKPTEMETNLSKVITQDINLSYTQKLILLRKLYMCPTSINPEVWPSQKMIEVVDLIQEKIIKNGNKRIYIILNDYIEDMIRNNQITQEDWDEILKSEWYIIDYVRFRLEEYSDLYPFDITSYHWNINNTQRSNMQNKFNDKESKGIQILFVSGNAAKVWIDLSWADTIIVYNEPYTVSDLNQEISRAYRVWLDHEIDIHTFITDNTIEIGIHTYINQKHKAIEKLIENKDLMTDMEINLILSEDINDLKYHPDTNFAQYYANEKSILYDMFSTNKWVWEDKFLENMSKVSMDGITNFEKYAEVYNMLWRRNYQSNANRINSQIISIISQKNEIKNPTIIDIWSWSQLLAKTINEDKQENIISIDINPNYMDNPFSKTILNDKNTYKYRQAIWSMMRWSMTDTYISDEYSDFVNISLAYHYTSINFKKNKIDRITSLIETNRILKPWWYAIINEIYSLNFAEKQKLQDALGLLWFEIMDQFTGNARSTDKNNFSSNILTIRKAWPSKKLSDLLDKKYQKSLEEWLSFDYNKDNISWQSFIIDKFEIWNNQYSINLNKSDKNLQNEESKTSSIIEWMKDQFGTIDSIPEKTLNNNWFFSYRYNQKKSLKKTRKIARKLSDGSFIFVV